MEKEYKMTPSQIKTKDALEVVHGGVINWWFTTAGELSVALPALTHYFDYEVNVITRRGKVASAYKMLDGEIVSREYF